MWKLSSGVFMGWSLGANDSANIFGTAVATGVVKYGVAIALTAVFVMLGANLEGPKCMATVGGVSRLTQMAAFWCTLATAITIALLTYLAIPASTSQGIIGAVIGAGIISGTADFSKLYKIVVCWLFTPVAGYVFSLFLYRLLGHLMKTAKIGIARKNLFLATGLLISGCYGAYTLGGNNVANVTGVYVSSGMLSARLAALIGGLSIAAGVLTYSRKVMMTVGKGIVPLDPFSAFITMLSEALTLHVFTQLGVPVSSSQAIVGAVVGVGYAGDSRTVSKKMLVKVGLGWLATPLLAGILTYLLLKLTVVFL
ncbi:MAG: inorganic phosphate transporter [Deltaproteobacteria bacterium]|nr:MAG: inorganic phosphate transporter [Deltaproteobacteria bacterium]